MKIILTSLFILLLLYSDAIPAPHLYEEQYHGFTVWLDCNRHGAIVFYYELDKDQGNFSKESGSLKRDDSAPKDCQPRNGNFYRTSTVHSSAGTWERVYCVPPNYITKTEQGPIDTFLIANILPQQSTFNQSKGAWFQTEKISESYREITRPRIWGGVIWGNDFYNDYFVSTHGVVTPDFWWNLIYRHDKKDFIAWLFPNNKTAKATKIDVFIMTIWTPKDRLEFVPDFGELE